MDSILNSIKQLLGVPLEEDAFDFEIITHINSTFSVLHQLGVGPPVEFHIEDDTEVWEDFFVGYQSPQLIKSYMFMKVKLFFDPPLQNASLLNAFQKRVEEFEWRLNLQAETAMPEVIL